DAFQQVGAVVRAFTRFLRTVADHPDAAAAVEKLAELHRAWVAALEKQFPDGNPDIAAAVDANKYVDAVQAAVQAKKRAAAAAGHEALIVVRVPQFAAPPYSAEITAAPLPVHSIRTTFQTLFTPAPTLPTPVSDEKRLKRGKLMQSLVVG